MNPTLKDAALRVFHTFWQSFLGALALTWTGVHFDASTLTDLDADKKLIVSVLVAVVAAILSAAKSTAATLWPAITGLFSKGDWTPQTVAAGLAQFDTAVPTATPADPSQPAAGVPPPATVPTTTPEA